MATRALPNRTDLASYSFTTDLEGTTYVFDFYWNDRAVGWFFNIKDSASNYILAGVRVVLGFPLAGRSGKSTMPPGVLMAVDTTGQNIEPGLNDLGGRVQLLYFETSGL